MTTARPKSDEKTMTGALRTWIGKPDVPGALWTHLDRCPECRSLALTEDLGEHLAWHRTGARSRRIDG